MRPRALLGAVVLLAACAAPPERELTVAMVEYGFLPSRIEVAAGERIRVVIKNVGLLEHDFNAGDRGRALGLEHVHLRPGGTGAIDWTAPANATSLRVVCTVAGHEQLGMVAALVVEPRSGASPSASR